MPFLKWRTKKILYKKQIDIYEDWNNSREKNILRFFFLHLLLEFRSGIKVKNEERVEKIAVTDSCVVLFSKKRDKKKEGRQKKSIRGRCNEKSRSWESIFRFRKNGDENKVER